MKRLIRCALAGANLLVATVMVATLLVVGCASLSPALIADGELAVSALQGLTSIAQGTPFVPAADIVLINGALNAVQADLDALKAGKTTAQAFAAAANSAVGQITDPILADVHANTTITQGVRLLASFAQTLLADVDKATPPVAGASPMAGEVADPRAALRSWVAAHPARR